MGMGAAQNKGPRCRRVGIGCGLNEVLADLGVK